MSEVRGTLVYHTGAGDGCASMGWLSMRFYEGSVFHERGQFHATTRHNGEKFFPPPPELISSTITL